MYSFDSDAPFRSYILFTFCLPFILFCFTSSLFFHSSLWLFHSVFIAHQHLKFVHKGEKNDKQSGLSRLSLFC